MFRLIRFFKLKMCTRSISRIKHSTRVRSGPYNLWRTSRITWLAGIPGHGIGGTTTNVCTGYVFLYVCIYSVFLLFFIILHAAAAAASSSSSSSSSFVRFSNSKYIDKGYIHGSIRIALPSELKTRLLYLLESLTSWFNTIFRFQRQFD